MYCFEIWNFQFWEIFYLYFFYWFIAYFQYDKRTYSVYVFNPLIFLKNFFIAQHTLSFVQCSITTWKVRVFFLMSVMSSWLCQVDYGRLVVQMLYIFINFFCLSYLKLWLWICLFLLPFPANFWLIQLKIMLLSAHNFIIIFSFLLWNMLFALKSRFSDMDIVTLGSVS